MSEPLLRVEHLKKYFPLRGGLKKNAAFVRAVDDVSFTIRPGETLGLVGESGCGKSTLGRTLVKIYEPTAGRILFDGKDVSALKGKERAEFCRRMQMIFQDP